MASNASINIHHSIIYKKYQESSKFSQNYVISAEGSLAGRQACCLLTHGILQVLTEARRREPDETLPAVETQLSRFTPVTGNSGTEYVHLQPAMTICLMSHEKESIRGDLKVDFMQSLKLWIKIFLKKDLEQIWHYSTFTSLSEPNGHLCDWQVISLYKLKCISEVQWLNPYFLKQIVKFVTYI